MDLETIQRLMEEYAEKHPLVWEMGSEYIMQDNKARVDALQLICDIWDNCLP